MSEFAPICIYLVISLLVSLIPLGLTVLVLSKESRKGKHLLYSFLLLLTCLAMFYSVFLSLGKIDLFCSLLKKALISLGARALSFALCKLGLPGGALLMAFFWRFLITEGTSEIGVVPLRMMPTGSDEGGNTDSGSWKKYLHLSSDSEGQGQEHGEAEPASRKRDRSTDPREDVGPSSVRRRVDSGSAPGVGDNVASQQAQSSDQISDEILESRLMELGADQLSEWVTSRLFSIEDRINELRQEEGMRQLGALRGEQVVQRFEQKYGTPAFDRILRDLQEKGLESPYYAESKIERSLPTEAELKKMDRNVTL